MRHAQAAIMVFGIALTGCQCLVPVAERDAGAADGGIDASVGDAGNDSGIRDAGGFDAGEIDAGVADASIADAGLVDAGNDSGMVDSGQADAGAPDASLFDAGTADAGLGDGGNDSGISLADAGAVDSGAPEGCNGFDDDGDGRIDLLPDGGVLTQACPLTLGVCAGAVSVCRDGGFTACDYGPNYQRTERNCDGLDNDCDGRIDHSWTRTLFERDDGGTRVGPCSGDPNSQSSLCFMDVAESLQVFPRTDGLLVSSDGRLSRFSPDLDLIQSATLPALGLTALFEDGSGWWRVVSIYDGQLLTRCAAIHHIDADGGYRRASDGGIDFVASACTNRAGRASVSARPGGFEALLASDNYSEPTPHLALAQLEFDGGSSLLARDLDAGLLGQFALPYAVNGEYLLIAQEQTSSVAYTCDSSLTVTPLLALPTQNYCTLSQLGPLVFDCRTSTSNPTTTWIYADGGIMFSRPGLGGINQVRFWGGPISNRVFTAFGAGDGGGLLRSGNARPGDTLRRPPLRQWRLLGGRSPVGPIAPSICVDPGAVRHHSPRRD